MPPDADERSVFNVLRLASNCSNFFKLVTSDTFTHKSLNNINIIEGIC